MDNLAIFFAGNALKAKIQDGRHKYLIHRAPITFQPFL